MRTVELLYFDDCPSWEEARAVLERALAATGVAAQVCVVNIADLPAARRGGFAGSPTIRIDGRDLEGYEGPPVLACRCYLENGGRGWPSLEQLQRALKAS